MGFTSKTGCGIFLKNRLWDLHQKQVVEFTSKAGCGVYLKSGCGIYLKNRLGDLPQKQVVRFTYYVIITIIQ